MHQPKIAHRRYNGRRRGNVVEGNFIGTDVTGNQLDGININANGLPGGAVSYYPFDVNTNDQFGLNNPSVINAVSLVPGKSANGASIGSIRGG